VKDAAGLSTTLGTTIGNIPGPQLNVAPTAATCANNDGIVTASPIGGTPPFQYSVNGGAFQTSPTFTGLPVGTKTIEVKDGNGCPE
jgi:hypothetical protein